MKWLNIDSALHPQVRALDEFPSLTQLTTGLRLNMKRNTEGCFVDYH